MANLRPVLDGILHDFRDCWKALALTDIAYKIVAWMALTPLVGLLFRTLLAASGKTVLADQDILFFFLRPVGWVGLILIGALSAGIVALELSALLGILGAPRQQPIGFLGGLRFASTVTWPVLQVTTRLVAYTLLTLAPFLVAAGLTYWALLTRYDINFYLQEKPVVFWVALGLGGSLAVALVAVLLRLFTGWLFALPLVLFEKIRPSEALKTSRARAEGHRPRLVFWMVVWLLATTLLSALTTATVIGFGRLLVPRATGSLGLLSLTIGVILLLWAGTNLVVNLLSTTAFASLLMNLYLRFGRQGELDTSQRFRGKAREDASRFPLTPKRLLIAGGAGTALALAAIALILGNVQWEDHVEITAHRGASSEAPENTMAAIKKAIADDADWVEIDVQETADGEVVVFHDSDFMKLAGVDLKIWDATLADLKEIDIGSWFDAKFSGERVPALAEVLDVCRGKVRVNIELKYYGHDQQLEQRVVDLVEARDMASDIVLMSLKIDAVKKMKQIRPDWKAGLLLSVSAGAMKNLDADFLAINARFANRSFIRSAHDSGKEVYVWTVNDAPTMSTMIGRGVDSLITDRPALARSVIRQRAQMNVPQRLLLELAGILGVTPEIGEP